MRRLAACVLLASLSHGATVPAQEAVGPLAQRVFQDCREVLVTMPVDEDKVRGLVPDDYPLLTSIDGSQRSVTVRAASCDYEIDGVKRATLEAEVRIDLDTAAMNATMNEGEENDSHIAGGPVCCDWYELSEISNNPSFATWYRTGTALDGVVQLSRDLEWRFDPDPVTGVGELVVRAPSPSGWGFEIVATVGWPDGSSSGVPGTINLWRETEKGRVQITAHDDGEDAGLRFGVVLEGGVVAHGSRLKALIGKRHDLAPAEGIAAEIENGVLSKRVAG